MIHYDDVKKKKKNQTRRGDVSENRVAYGHNKPLC